MYNQYRNTLYDKGYLPLPVKGKVPMIKKFNDNKYTPPTGYDGFNIAILCGRTKYPVCAIDIDTTDAKITQTLIDHTWTTLKPSLQRVGQPPKTLLVYRTQVDVHKKQTHRYDKGHVEILGKGQYFVTHGTHINTGKPYVWIGTNIIHVQASELPLVSEKQLDTLIVDYNEILKAAGCHLKEKVTKTENGREYDASDPLLAKNPLQIPQEELSVKLKLLNPGCSRQRWIQIGMALHHETGGTDKGFTLWDTWSSTSDKYNKNEMQGQWDSFGKTSKEPITIAYILKLAKEEEVFKKDKISIDPITVYIPTWDNAPRRSAPMLTLNGHRILSRGSIALISAPAGQGKTQVVSAICAATKNNDFDNIDTLGFESTADSIMYIDTEQNRWEHNNIWQKCMLRLGLSKGQATPTSISFRLISEMPNLKDRKTFLFDTIHNDTPPDIVLLDGIGDYVSDVNDATECVALIYRLSAMIKQKDIALLTTLHVNPSANAEKMRGVLGSELWRKAEFSALIKRVDGEVRCLTTEYLLGKNRSGVDILSQYFKWCAETQMMISCKAPTTTSKQASSNAVQLILDMLYTKRGQEIRRKDISDLPCSRHSIDQALILLEEQGQIQTVKNGRINLYRICEEDLTLW